VRFRRIDAFADAPPARGIVEMRPFGGPMIPGPLEHTTALPTTILADRDADARQSLSAATRTAYESDWRAFEGWCDERGVDALPSSPAAVAAFPAQRRAMVAGRSPWSA
jgi:hypothetical protein